MLNVNVLDITEQNKILNEYIIYLIKERKKYKININLQYLCIY